MNISCKTENLKKGLTLVSHIVGKNQNLPILNNVLLVCDEGMLTLATTNLEVGIQTQVRGKVSASGSITIPAKLLNDYVSNISAETVTLTAQDMKLTIAATGSKTTIKGIDAAEFPLLPNIEAVQSFELTIPVLRQALKQTVFAASRDTARPELSNVLAQVRDNAVTLAATDSYRLAEKKISIQSSAVFDILIPQNTLIEVQRVFDQSEDANVLVEVNDNQIKFSNKQTFLISRISEGQFPDYQQIIPENNTTTAIVAVSALSQAVRATSIFCRQGIDDIKFIFGDNTLRIEALNDQVGESAVDVQIEVAGDESQIVFNYHYVLDVLSVIQDSEVIIGVSDSSLPGIVRPKQSDDYQYVIMPIKQ